MDDLQILARTTGPRGEVALRRRGHGDDAVEELIVNGAFAMDSAETSSERNLAHLAWNDRGRDGRMLIGGLGLGYTVHEALSLPVTGIDVVEIEGALVQWARDGVTPTLSRVAADPRVTLLVSDVAEVLAGAEAGAYQAIALDVDNGPDFLIHARNASLYTRDLLQRGYSRLAPGGRLAIWCQGPSPELMSILGSIAPTARQHSYQVRRGERRFAYVICTLDRVGEPDPSAT